MKPENLFVTKVGDDYDFAKVLDFGLVKVLGNLGHTTADIIQGTPAYLAPELARGADPAPPSDVFSLGATIYALTEGEPPFGKSTNDLGLLYKVARGETRPPTRSGPLTGLLVRMLSNEPSQRPTAVQAAQELKAIASGAVSTVTRVIPPGPPPRSGTAVMPSTGPGTQGPRSLPPQGPPPRTRPPAPLPEPEYEPEPEPERRSNRGLAIAAAVLGVLLIAGIAYAIVQSDKTTTTADDPSSTPITPSETSVTTSEKPAQNTPAPPTQKQTQTKPSQPPSSAPPPASKFSKAQVTQFVQRHYAKLPKDVQGALDDWDPNAVPSPNSEKEYWSGYTKVAIQGTPLVVASDDGTFTVTTALQLTEAETDKTTTEEHVLKISGKGEKLLIVAEERG